MELTEGLIPGAGLDSAVFAQDELVRIAAPGHPILAQKGVRAKDFAGLPFVLREPGSGTRAVIERALGELGLRAAEVISLGSTEAIKRVVASGLGVAIVSRLAVMTEEQTGTLAVVPLVDLKVPRPLHRVRSQGLTDGPTHKAFDQVLAGTLPAEFRCSKTPRAQ